MPFALIIVGLLMVITAANNTHAQMAAQLRTDGTAFTKWLVAFGMIGAAGYIKDLQGLSRAFMTLMIIAMVLSNSKTGRGLFGNFSDAIAKGPATITPANDAAAPSLNLTGAGSGPPDPVTKKAPGQGLFDWIFQAPSVTFQNPFGSNAP